MYYFFNVKEMFEDNEDMVILPHKTLMKDDRRRINEYYFYFSYFYNYLINLIFTKRKWEEYVKSKPLRVKK